MTAQNPSYLQKLREGWVNPLGATILATSVGLTGIATSRIANGLETPAYGAELRPGGSAEATPSPSAPALPTPEEVAASVEGNWAGKDIARLLITSGFPLDKVAYATAISMAEVPSGDPNAVGDTWNHTRVFDDSEGLYQVRTFQPDYLANTPKRDLDPQAPFRVPGRNFDPVKAAESMSVISNHGEDFGAWAVDAKQPGQKRALVEDRMHDAMKQTAEAFGSLGLEMPKQDFGPHQSVLTQSQDQGATR